MPEGLLFHLSGDHGLTAEVAAPGTAEPNFAAEVEPIPGGAVGSALRCANTQRLAYLAPGNIYAQRGTLAFFWRARDAVGPTEFPVFRVSYADHSSWDMVWLRIDYNGHGFDAFVTDASLARTRVSVTLDPFPQPDTWIHLAFTWDETEGVKLYVDGRLAGEVATRAVYDAALDQFGPHSRIISPYQVQSDYNFVRGGDLDELRIYDHALDATTIAALAKPSVAVPAAAPVTPSRALSDARWRAAWRLRHGWEGAPPPVLTDPITVVRKVEIHDAYDLKRWWWKATDGIRETTWPGVFNRSRLPGRNDYFQLPDWDCYSLSGKTITFQLPDEPWNHVEISGAAFGRLSVADRADAPLRLWERRAAGHERTVHRLAEPRRGGVLRFDNDEQETPIGELVAYHVHAGAIPVGSFQQRFRLVDTLDTPATEELERAIDGRFPREERRRLFAVPITAGAAAATAGPPEAGGWPVVQVVVPSMWDERAEGLDGLALRLPALALPASDGAVIPFNVQVHDPLWPGRLMADFSFSVKPGEARTLWLDLRDRLLPKGRALWVTVASAAPEFGPEALRRAELTLVFKPRAEAVAEHVLDRFTQMRDSYAMLVEEHPNTRKYRLWARFEDDLGDLLRVAPDHVPGRYYAAVELPGAQRPPLPLPEVPAGVPRWAFWQTEALRRVTAFVDWWIEHRQIPNGEFGGGISDDVDLTNLWPAVAFMGADHARYADSAGRLLDAAYRQGMFTDGLGTIQTDELHSYEEGINALGQMLLLNPGSPKQLERAMETTRALQRVTGVNAAGHRHFRSSYYSGSKIAEEGVWGWAKPYSHLVLQPAQLLVNYNGSPAAKTLLLELSDGLLAHWKPESKAFFPPAIHFASDTEAATGRGYFPWPMFWTAWQWTGEARYLAPLEAGGLGLLTSVNANVVDALGLRSRWADLTQAPSVVAERRPGDGRAPARSSTTRGSSREHFDWQVSGDKGQLEALYRRQVETMILTEYINTEGSLWSDRVAVPNTELQRARLGGVGLVRNAPYPGHVVSWQFAAPARADSVALLIPDATPTAFKVVACNLEAYPVTAYMTGANIEPGEWMITHGADTDDDDKADGLVTARTERFERARTLAFTLAPKTTTVLSLTRVKAGTPYWQRPDLGVEREDVVVHGGEVRVTVHSLGSVPTPASLVVLRTRAGEEVARERIPAMAAPVDLMPRRLTVALTLPEGVSADGLVLELEPAARFEEITRGNNRVEL